MKKALVILADGFEELEAVTVMDLLVRADVHVVRVGLKPGPVKASRNTVLIPDTELNHVMNDHFDAVILPGGLPGADNLRKDTRVLQLLQRQYNAERLIGAICAAPRVLADAGVTAGKRITHYPGSLDGFNLQNAIVTGSVCEVDFPIVTSRGPGTAITFALTLIEILESKELADRVASALAA